MYLSHPVRQIREDPQPNEAIGLVVELDDDSPPDALARLRETVTDAGGTVGRELGFGAHHVTVPEPAVATLVELSNVVRIETDATISLGAEERPDEGEADADDHSVDDLRKHLDGEGGKGGEGE